MAAAQPAAIPAITPAQAGAVAVARLELPLNRPVIGPPPEINEWKMAAVGYPLWLSVDGATHLGPVSDTVAGLRVSLEADLDRTEFRMGDGEKVYCWGAGKAWGRWVEPGTPSPACGYRYQDPSLPAGSYTVTAVSHWEVRWRVNGQSGVIDVPQSASMELPVGEIQALVR